MPSFSRAPSWLRRLAPLSGGLALSLLLHICAKFAKDIVAAYQSPQLQKFFKANPVWAGYRMPDYFNQ